MLKSAMALMSKQRSRALARKSCPYLNKWANPVFIGIPFELGCSGDPVGLNSECYRRVDMLQVHKHRGMHCVSLTRRRRLALGAKAGARIGPVADSVSGARRRQAAGAVFYAMAKYSTDPGSVAWSGVTGPVSDQLVVHKGEEPYTGGDGHSILFPGKGSVVAGGFCPINLVWRNVAPCRVMPIRVGLGIYLKEKTQADQRRQPEQDHLTQSARADPTLQRSSDHRGEMGLLATDHPTQSALADLTLSRSPDHGGEMRLLSTGCRPELNSRFISKKKPKSTTGCNPNGTARHSLS
ncbi:hypothetical protein TIFTF001_030608 [Ficus carica]|uniref:Uncharacterized protein n=1 Tax=Ficus carica TaxID=3494 RepID=A0AA88DTD9_FICCA|nr:hypothetical protein TIFTF001_030608 [Ficus carica]